MGCWVDCAAQSKATIDVSETIFSVFSAMNVCGYDQELASSSPIRAEVRADLVAASKSPDAAAAAKAMCKFYEDHRRRFDPPTGAVRVAGTESRRSTKLCSERPRSGLASRC